MYTILIVLLTFFPFVQSSCNGYKDCFSCANSSILAVKCRWCQLSKSCHLPGSIYNTCQGCTDSWISKHCSVTNPEKCDKHDDAKSGDFEPFDAYNALLYSAIAYSNKSTECANSIFQDGDFKIVETIGRKCNYFFEYELCFAITAVSHSKKQIILAYRGTKSTLQLFEEFVTVLGKFKVSTKIGGHVQEYFSNANNELYSCVKSSVRDLVNEYPTYSVIVAGHSLGGAVASIASAQLVFDSVIDKEKTTLYTFGMPRTGDRVYAKNHGTFLNKSWRVVHYKDIVSQLPTMTSLPSSPYHHQREIFYGDEMSRFSDYIECFDFEDKKCSLVFQPSLWSVNYHRIYYGINVGGHCKDLVGDRKRRSVDGAEFNNLFSNVTCKRIKVSDAHETVKSGNTKFRNNFVLIVAMLCFFRMSDK